MVEYDTISEWLLIRWNCISYFKPTMQLKQHESSLMVHRPRKRKNLGVDPKQQQKSQNLKSLHQTLLCEESYHHKGAVGSVLSRNSRNLSRRQGSELSRQRTNLSREKDKQVNFYINIEKLKNLRISSNKEQDPKRTKSSASVLNSYVGRGGSNVERRSELLKRYGAGRKHNQSQDHMVYESVGRLPNERESKPQNKGRNRYMTEQDEEAGAKIQQSQHNKNASGFKRAQNQLHLKDKTFIEGYLRGKQLGRGGFSKVWEGFHFKTKLFYAVKEIDTTNKYQTHLTEIWFGNFFFEGGQPKKEFEQHEGISSLLKMFAYSIVDPRAFIVYENCQGSLGNMLYDIYEEDRDEEVEEDDKLYMIKFKPLYSELKKSPCFLRTMVYQIAQALDLLAKNKIVHSDIKTQNILLNTHESHPRYQFKLIDYGSSFVFQNLKQYKLATPEYMCPELLNYILFENKKPHREEMLPFVKNYNNISAIDVWGLGCILIELIHGLPLWLSNRTKILVQGRYETKRGLFAVSDRSFSKILQRQLYIVDNFEAFLKKENNSGIVLDDTLKQLIKQMLIPDPSKRIQPHQIIATLGGKQS